MFFGPQAGKDDSSAVRFYVTLFSILIAYRWNKCITGQNHLVSCFWLQSRWCIVSRAQCYLM